ncbi:hypothetical protein KY305_04135 [Bacillus sp. YC2]|uniref:hypothetical protein n=1 Tax=Bacillus sp. YC2 TaxID=2861287 RepID=UPI001CA78AC7|nr:hypothetical protein [Bacillus sp. YC2]MBY8911950.1 hypothetical protein [Bacillus sp. YC2]
MGFSYEKRGMAGSAAQLVAASCPLRCFGFFLYRSQSQEQKQAEIRSYLFYYFGNRLFSAFMDHFKAEANSAENPTGTLT